MTRQQKISLLNAISAGKVDITDLIELPAVYIFHPDSENPELLQSLEPLPINLPKSISREQLGFFKQWLENHSTKRKERGLPPVVLLVPDERFDWAAYRD